RIDGADVATTVTGGRVEWPGAPALAGGTHDATVSARFATEGASRASRLRFHLLKPPARVLLDVQGAPLGAERPVFALHARVLDREDLAVRDGFAVRISSEPRGMLSPAETTLAAWDGEAWGYLRRARKPTTASAARAAIVARIVDAKGALLAPPA